MLHPHSGARLAILHEMLEQPSVYWRLEGHHLNESALLNQWQACLDQTRPPAWIMVDECDRASDDALAQWLDGIMSQTNSQVILIGRRISSALYSDHLRPHSEIFPHAPMRLLNDFTRYSGERHLLEVRTLGQGQIILNGRVVEQWEGVLPRLLFFYFVDKAITTRDDIFSAFWPDSSVKDATNVFHVTKRKLHEILGIDLTIYDNGYYRLAPNIDLSYDVSSFSHLIRESEIVNDGAAERLIYDAIGLYRGDFLSTVSGIPWIMRRRQEVVMAYADALIRLAIVSERLQKPDNAINLYLQAWALGLHDEDILNRVAELAKENGQDSLVPIIQAQRASIGADIP